MLLDACHAGHVTQSLVVPNEALAASLVREQRAGAIVFAASKGRQVSFETETSRGVKLEPTAQAMVQPTGERPRGFFTGAILQTLADPGADHNADGVLQASELLDEVTRRVTRGSKGMQTPWVAHRDLFGDFGIANVR